MKARANERNASLLVIVQRVQPSFKPKGLNDYQDPSARWVPDCAPVLGELSVYRLRGYTRGGIL